MMLLSEAAKAINAQLIGDDVIFTSVGTDSRNIISGQLFVALKGENYDGHNFALQAIEQGAVAALVSDQSLGEKAYSRGSALVVNDTCKALGDLSAYWRSRFEIPLAAITGSNGKTTVKEMLASILRACVKDSDKVLATEGNLNNHIGLPLTLLKLRAHHRYAVIEMGMNHSGELSYLTNLSKPTLVLINNAGNAHIGELGSIEAIAKAKGEILEGLAKDGFAVINADDDYVKLWERLAGKHKKITFGLKNKANVSADYRLKGGSCLLEIKSPKGRVDANLPIPGIHNVMNALAATAASICLDVPLDAIKEGLESYAGVKGRLQYKQGINGALVIDDSYNANPASMKAAIDVLVSNSGEKLLVLGDMGELGEKAAELHSEIGHYAKDSGVDKLYTLGILSQEASKAFGIGACHYQDKQVLISDLAMKIKPISVVLVKGSRFMAMEQIVNEITNNIGGEH